MQSRSRPDHALAAISLAEPCPRGACVRALASRDRHDRRPFRLRVGLCSGGASLWMESPSPMRTMPKSTGSTFVPKSMQATYEAVTTLTDAFCREHLNKDYRVLAQRMTGALCRKRPSPLASGQPRTWACGIVYVLGQINFLTDPSTTPFIPRLIYVPGLGSARARRAQKPA